MCIRDRYNQNFFANLTACSAILESNVTISKSYRIYIDGASVAYPNGSPEGQDALKTSIMSALAGPSAVTRAFYSDFVFCNTPGCNAPSSDACGLGAPTPASATFSSLPESAVDNTTNRLTPNAVTILSTTLKAGVESVGGCPACTVTLMQVVEKATGRVLYSFTWYSSSLRQRALAPAPRRAAALGEVTVSFEISGGTAATLAKVQAATATGAFANAVAESLAKEPGYEGVGVTANPVPAARGGDGNARALGLGLGLGLGLAAVAGAAACVWKKRQAKKVMSASPPGPAKV